MSSSNQRNRLYPNLEACRVVLRNSSASNRPPIRLPKECLDAAADSNANAAIPPPYDFVLERSVLKKKAERDEDFGIGKADSREELQRAVVTRMKSVTNAEEDVCISLLESNDYDLKTSIEAFFSNS